MNPQQANELGFWRAHYEAMGHNVFVEQRRSDYESRAARNCADVRLGKGLEVGTGLLPLLRFSEGHGSVTCIDPLMGEFQKICPVENVPGRSLTCLTMDGEDMIFPDETFDWAVCWNVLDHTPDHTRMFSEIHRVLRRGGKLYFSVNLADELEPDCHYTLWDWTNLCPFVETWFRPTYSDNVREPGWIDTQAYLILVKP